MPAAAVIPAPIAYIKVVVVKLLVDVFLSWADRSAPGVSTSIGLGMNLDTVAYTLCNTCVQTIYFEEIKVFRACARTEHDSME